MKSTVHKIKAYEIRLRLTTTKSPTAVGQTVLKRLDNPSLTIEEIREVPLIDDEQAEGDLMVALSRQQR